LELASQRPRHGLHREGLGQPGDAFQQNMAIGQQGHEQPPDQVLLAHHDAVDLGPQPLEQR